MAGRRTLVHAGEQTQAAEDAEDARTHGVLPATLGQGPVFALGMRRARDVWRSVAIEGDKEIRPGMVGFIRPRFQPVRTQGFR